MIKLQKDPKFKHHATCEKLCLTNLAFSDEVLLFAKRDARSVELMMRNLHTFSKSTWFVVNPRKCMLHFGGVDESIKDAIKRLTNFKEGSLPFKNLGVFLTSKHLFIHHYTSLL